MKDSRQSVPAYSWFVVAMLWVVALLNYLDRMLITSMRDPIVANFSLNDAQFGLLTSVFLWSYGILSPFGGYFADRYSRKKVIVFSIIIWSAVTLWTGIASSFYELLTARTFMGISEAFYIPAALALITDYHKSRTRSLATGLHMSGLYAGLALGGVGGYIAELWGWRYGFQIFGVFGILYSFVLIFFLKDRKPEDDESDISSNESVKESISIKGSLKALFKERSFIIIMVFFCAMGIVNWLVYSWLPTFLKEDFSLSLGKAGISATFYIQAGSFAGVLLGGVLADRWSRVNIKGRLYVVIAGMTIGAPILFLMASTSIFSIAIIAMIVFGLARGFNDSNIMPILCQVVDNKYIATGYGFLNFLSTIVSGVMVYIGGALKDANIGLSVIYQAAAIMMLLATWLLFTVKIKKEG
ncbi:MAG TPA: MFS transporter [Bacteroidales bacterium]|mgnify:CR=1 FL=1|nr:MFS transporter [Bacteroidales bacterium]HQG37202.1 MFS transporter [Bacteroidales bacterium]HQG53258.1 MFS transporter [Bacteroidales bacterium]HQJ21364.1 MFS transporter [Bacteroidales bacterium]